MLPEVIRNSRRLWPPNRGWTGEFLWCFAPRPATLALLIALALGAALPAQQKPLRERLLESAQKGDADAQFELGKNYETGRIGLPKDLAQAEHWYRLSAVQGDPFAEASLGILYQFGKGVPRNSVQALMWYEVAIARSRGGDRDSIAELRDDLIAGMTAAQIAEARRLAREFIPRDNKSKR